jgi:hypothetical protein
MKRREKSIEKACKNWAIDHGFWVRKFKSPGRRSAPDDVFCHSGVIVFWEFKAEGEKPTKLQDDEHKLMRSHGMIVRWTSDVEWFKASMKALYPWAF